ncbi:hypothetical protein AAMO2058_000360800 [Amorphochlora amoebiformis]
MIMVERKRLKERPPALNIGHGSTTANSDGADVPISALLGKAGTPLAVFSSSGNFRPPNVNATSLTGLVSLTFTENKNEIPVEGITDRIIITLGSRSLGEENGIKFCQFWNETLNVQNLTIENILNNPFTLLALITVFCIYFSLLAVGCITRGKCASRTKREASKRNHERDFLMQWYLQVIKKPRKTDAQIEEERNKLRQNLKKTTNDIGSAFSVRRKRTVPDRLPSRMMTNSTDLTVSIGTLTRGLNDRKKVPEFPRVQTKNSSVSGETKNGMCTWMYNAICCKQKPKSKEEIQTQERKERVVNALKLAFLSSNGEQNALKDDEDSKTEEVDNGKDLPDEWMRIKRIWWKLLTVRHVWISILYFHRRDPFGLEWRANVLLQALLLVMVTNGFFYGLNQSESGEVMIGLISAIVVSFFTILLVHLAKKIGKLQWRLDTYRLRDRLCIRRKSTRTITSFDGGKSAQGVLQVGGRVRTQDSMETQICENTGTVGRNVFILQGISWIIFIIVVGGCGFTILVLGMQFDLSDGNQAKSLQESKSFKWLTSVIISEGFNALLFSPLTIFITALILVVYGGNVALLNLLLSEDDLSSIHAYDTFLDAVKGWELTPDARARLRLLRARAKLQQRVSESDITIANDHQAPVNIVVKNDNSESKSDSTPPYSGFRAVGTHTLGPGSQAVGVQDMGPGLQSVGTQDLGSRLRSIRTRDLGSGLRVFGTKVLGSGFQSPVGFPSPHSVDSKEFGFRSPARVRDETPRGMKKQTTSDGPAFANLRIFPQGSPKPEERKSKYLEDGHTVPITISWDRINTGGASEAVEDLSNTSNGEGSDLKSNPTPITRKRRGTILLEPNAEDNFIDASNMKSNPTPIRRKRRGTILLESKAGDNFTQDKPSSSERLKAGRNMDPFEDLPIVNGKLKIRHMDVKKGKFTKFVTKHVSLAKLRVPDSRVILIYGPSKRVVDRAIKNSDFADNHHGVQAIHTIMCVEPNPQHNLRFQIVGLCAETGDTTLFEFALRSGSKKERDGWVTVLQWYQTRAQETGTLF